MSLSSRNGLENGPVDLFGSVTPKLAQEAANGAKHVTGKWWDQSTSRPTPSAASTSTPKPNGVPAVVPAPAPAAPAKPYGVSSWDALPLSWANRLVTNEQGSHDGANGHFPVREKIKPSGSGKSIIDCLLFVAANGGENLQSKTLWRKYLPCLDQGLVNGGKQRYLRRGLRNNSNLCYLNAVIQSLLPCSALMQLLSNCDQSSDRPFSSMLVRLCMEFHGKGQNKAQSGTAEAFNVISLSQVKDVLECWQSVGSQQDAGEFMFYILNGMHEECKWKTNSSTVQARTVPNATAADGEASWSEVGKANRKVEVRHLGLQEDSPIQRIFGGVQKSVVRSKNARADSVTMEPFTQLILDISNSSVNSVSNALQGLCTMEQLEGKTKRIQFQVLPHILIINLKRFTYDATVEGGVRKVKKAIRYEEKLRFHESLLAEDVTGPEYTLIAVICHHGDRADRGHYNAQVRFNESWYMYDDAVVRPMDIREVIRGDSYAPYLLVYQSNSPKVDIRP